MIFRQYMLAFDPEHPRRSAGVLNLDLFQPIQEEQDGGIDLRQPFARLPELAGGKGQFDHTGVGNAELQQQGIALELRGGVERQAQEGNI